MSSDLVSRLRKEAEAWAPPHGAGALTEIFTAAADEIERLVKTVTVISALESISASEALRLSEAFDRSADWLAHGRLQGDHREFPLVGLADYKAAALLLREFHIKINEYRARREYAEMCERLGSDYGAKR